ncbi:hypothetical protein F0562_011002 [Nyssa sinensis]|uniref:Uncharacterized protein n=1 Tax=Nyssa sinensis TaxID=561372 RepID=A0A5J5A2P7_9ASTE|nr:hypothetical protein F0562_011002 [Nyssa sinensis]
MMGQMTGQLTWRVVDPCDDVADVAGKERLGQQAANQRKWKKPRQVVSDSGLAAGPWSVADVRLVQRIRIAGWSCGGMYGLQVRSADPVMSVFGDDVFGCIACWIVI